MSAARDWSRVKALFLAALDLPESERAPWVAEQCADDPDTRLLLDVDLAILGAAPARFAESSRQVRAEYAHVPDATFRAGRARVLAGFLQRPRIYVTDVFRDALEERARANLQQALEALSA